jgi:hypothetical protein
VARRLIQREFLGWLKATRGHLLVDIRVDCRSDRILEFSFIGFGSTLKGVLMTYEVNVYAFYRGQCYELVASIDAQPIVVASGYQCGFCLPEHQRTYRNRETLWKEHAFERFLDWVNQELAPAKWIVFEGDIDTWSTATLATHRPKPSNSDTSCVMLELHPARRNVAS